MTPHDHEDDHDHDHEGHDHVHDGGAAGAGGGEAPAPFDPSRYEGIDGYALRRVSEVERELLAVVPVEQHRRAEDAAARDLARKVNIKGFRPGKVPPARVKVMFAREVRERAIEQLVQDTWSQVLEREKVRPIANPRVTEMSAEPGQPVRFAARFEELPDVTLQGLDAVRVGSKKVQVADRDVDAQLDELRAMRSELVPSEADEARPGDTAVVDLERWPAGASRDEAPAETGNELLVEVGHEKNLAELDKALLGMAKGESRTFDAKVPVPGGEGEELAPFRVTLRDVRTRRVPELDDAFAQSLGDFPTVADLRAKVRERLLEERTDAARREQESEAMEQLVRSNPVPIPPALIDQEAEARIRRGLEQLARRGIDVQSADLDLRGELARAREAAERDLRADFVLELVARERGIEVTDEDLQAEIARLAGTRGVAASAMRAELERAKQINNLRASLRRRRTLDLLRSDATISVE